MSHLKDFFCYRDTRANKDLPGLTVYRWGFFYVLKKTNEADIQTHEPWILRCEYDFDSVIFVHIWLKRWKQSVLAKKACQEKQQHCDINEIAPKCKNKLKQKLQERVQALYKKTYAWQ